MNFNNVKDICRSICYSNGEQNATHHTQKSYCSKRIYHTQQRKQINPKDKKQNLVDIVSVQE